MKMMPPPRFDPRQLMQEGEADQQALALLIETLEAGALKVEAAVEDLKKSIEAVPTSIRREQAAAQLRALIAARINLLRLAEETRKSFAQNPAQVS